MSEQLSFNKNVSLGLRLSRWSLAFLSDEQARRHDQTTDKPFVRFSFRILSPEQLVDLKRKTTGIFRGKFGIEIEFHFFYCTMYDTRYSTYLTRTLCWGCWWIAYRSLFQVWFLSLSQEANLNAVSRKVFPHPHLTIYNVDTF